MATVTHTDSELIARLGMHPLRARGVVEGTLSGAHPSPFHGFNVEFAAYREYTPGDDLRRVDWRVFARSDRFYIKEYEEESNLKATLIVDGSRSMRYGPPGRTKFDVAARVALALAHLLIDQRDPTGLALFDVADRLAITPAATRAQFARLEAALDGAEPTGDTDLGPVLETVAGRMRRRGMVIILSDLLTDLDRFREGLRRLRFTGHDLTLIHILDRDELEMPFNGLVEFVDIEGTERLLAEPHGFRDTYREAMRDFLAEVESICGDSAVDRVELITDRDPGDILSHWLHARANRR